MPATIQKLTLNNGVLIPALGFGTFAKDQDGVVKDEVYMKNAVLSALNAGYTHLDCAELYGNEDQVGQGLKEYLSQNPTVKRSDIFITTKVWPHLCAPEDVEWSLNNSLKDLGTDYMDCFLIHWPLVAERTEDRKVKLDADGKYIINEALTKDLSPVWKKMEELYKSGKAKSIGVSNWTISGLEALLSYASIVPAINQIEIHPFFPNTALVDYCFSKNILPVAYSPLGSQNLEPVTGKSLLENPELKSIAEKKGISVGQLCIAWGLKRGYAVLPKSTNEERIKKNAELVELSTDEFQAINSATKGKNIRMVDLSGDFGRDIWAEK